ncbi:T complex protein 1 subunit eta [Trichuris trichiura]|uniref:T-complex protein 1 subunit eta n=1 Tax=Trichuris trichiura TaxID=36087 RepID=A0A077ZD87_TRITR|nr:T complex protein 1 subunit eta [Trichuris trichiura]
MSQTSHFAPGFDTFDGAQMQGTPSCTTPGSMIPGHSAAHTSPQVAEEKLAPGNTVGQQQTGGMNPLVASRPGEPIWVETTTSDGKVYFYHSTTRESVWERPSHGVILKQNELEHFVKSGGTTYSEAAGHQPQTAPNSVAGQKGGIPSAICNLPPPMMIPPASWGAFPPMAPSNLPMVNQVPTWLEYFTAEGRPYYFNPLSGETSWTRPSEAKNGLPGPDAATGANASGIAISQSDGATKGNAETKIVGQEDSKTTTAAATSLDAAKPVVQGTQKHDQARPISSNPVAGTSWCVVWTGDRKVFFYNPTTRTSVWERPPELYGRPDVDLLVSKPPEPRKNAGGTSVNSTTTAYLPPFQQSTAPKEEPVKKKRKKAEHPPSEAAAPPPKVETAEPIKPRDGAFEAEIKAAHERAQIPLEVRTGQFKQMLQEKDVSAFSTWEKELHKIVFDPRYLLLTSKERKTVFDEYVKERADVERNERKKKLKEARDSFQQLLEEAEITYKTAYDDFASKYAKDSRFKAIEKSRDRETLFDDYIRALRIKEREEKQALQAKLKNDFIELLKEQPNVKKRSRWSEVKKTISQDARYRQVESSSMREDWFREYCKSLPSDNSDDEEEEARKERLKAKERKIREEVAQKAREKEVRFEEPNFGISFRDNASSGLLQVAAELESQMKERSKEIEKHVMQESEENFKALLADLIKATDQSWRDCKKRLRKDSRWETADMLDRHQKEKLFDEHVRQLEMKQKEAFLQLLEETADINFSTTWKEAKKLIKNDIRYARFSSRDRRCEREFKDFIQNKLSQAKENFLQLLKESKIMTPKSKQLILEDEQHLKDVLSVLEEGTEQATGKQHILSNIQSCQVIAEAVRTTLGPRGMDKMIIDKSGKSTISNDGATILKLLNVAFPAASILVQLAKSQDAEIGDGTTSVVLLASELLANAKTFIEDGVHPQCIISAYSKAVSLAVDVVNDISVKLEANGGPAMEALIRCAETTLSSKLVATQKKFFAKLVVEAVSHLGDRLPLNMIGIKKVSGGSVEDSELVLGVAFQKTFSYAGFEMQPKVYKNPKIALLNIELEIKAERDNAELTLTNVDEYQKVVDAEWTILYDKLQAVHDSGAKIVLSRLPIGDVATQWFADRDMFCAGRVEESDLKRMLEACGGTILTSVSGITPESLGSCEQFQEKQIGSERYNFFTGCTKAKACTFVLRGGAEQFIDETERSLHDAIMIVRRALKNDFIVAGKIGVSYASDYVTCLPSIGGGATEMEISKRLREHALTITGKEQLLMCAFAKAFEAIPRQLCFNAGLDATNLMNKLRAMHHEGATLAGINLQFEDVRDNLDAFVWEPAVAKTNAIRAATEAACVILSIDESVKSPSGGAPNMG